MQLKWFNYSDEIFFLLAALYSNEILQKNVFNSHKNVTVQKQIFTGFIYPNQNIISVFLLTLGWNMTQIFYSQYNWGLMALQKKQWLSLSHTHTHHARTHAHTVFPVATLCKPRWIITVGDQKPILPQQQPLFFVFIYLHSSCTSNFFVFFSLIFSVLVWTSHIVMPRQPHILSGSPGNKHLCSSTQLINY